MGHLRYFRRVSLLPGLRLNASRRGLSVSVGHRGLGWLTVGPRGRRVTVDTPIKGLYYTEQLPPAPLVHHGHRLALLIAVVVLVAVVWWLAST
jgi:hypothetical protein